MAESGSLVWTTNFYAVVVVSQGFSVRQGVLHVSQGVLHLGPFDTYEAATTAGLTSEGSAFTIEKRHERV